MPAIVSSTSFPIYPTFLQDKNYLTKIIKYCFKEMLYFIQRIGIKLLRNVNLNMSMYG
jgi:hypothetical protein